MKKLFIILLGVVYVSLLSGCKDSEPEDIDRDLRIYNLNFVFEDKDGKMSPFFRIFGDR